MDLQLELSLSTALPLFHNTNSRNGFVVGWPPVRNWRKQLCRRSSNGRIRNWMYVKVKMEGVGITRKIDLSVHRSHRTLATKLISLFPKSVGNVDYRLMYQNNEGQWLRPTDVPWECFINSVRRLRLEKNGYSSYFL